MHILRRETADHILSPLLSHFLVGLVNNGRSNRFPKTPQEVPPLLSFLTRRLRPPTAFLCFCPTSCGLRPHDVGQKHNFFVCCAFGAAEAQATAMIIQLSLPCSWRSRSCWRWNASWLFSSLRCRVWQSRAWSLRAYGRASSQCLLQMPHVFL